MCGSMVDIQSATAEIRRGKKEERKIDRRKKLQDKHITGPITYGGHNKQKKDTDSNWSHVLVDMFLQ